MVLNKANRISERSVVIVADSWVSEAFYMREFKTISGETRSVDLFLLYLWIAFRICYQSCMNSCKTHTIKFNTSKSVINYCYECFLYNYLYIKSVWILYMYSLGLHINSYLGSSCIYFVEFLKMPFSRGQGCICTPQVFFSENFFLLKYLKCIETFQLIKKSNPMRFCPCLALNISPSEGPTGHHYTSLDSAGHDKSNAYNMFI